MTSPRDSRAFCSATSILCCLQAERRGEPAPGFAEEGMNAAFARIGVFKAALVRSLLEEALDLLEAPAKPLPPDEPDAAEPLAAQAVRREKRLLAAIPVAVGIAAAVLAIGLLMGVVQWP